ncbi:tail protein [Escherichia phage Bp4]|uniref:Tail fiber protein n=1 Tax=Escherichia phage Bp4 TaxID=1458848 RepID=X2KS55_9CAUD|nr:tail protein [Escherichia phage Bp4]AHN83356.1 tail fiber protein [Escherichia phage Bp4]
MAMNAHTPFDAKQDWTNPYCQNSSNDPMVDALLGNAYHVVRTVYCNLGNLKLIYDFLNQYGMVLGVQSEAELKALTTKAKYARIYGFSRTGDRQVTDYLYVEGDRTGILPDDTTATGSWITVATSGSTGGGGTSSSEGAYIPWVYSNGSATGGETTINVPDGTVGVPFIIINGDMQYVGRGFEFNADNLSVTLAQPLEEGDEVVFLLTGVPAVPDNPNVNDWVQINWLYNNGAAVGGEQVIAIPYTFQSIPAVYKNGLRLYKGLTTESYTADPDSQRILLTEPLTTNDRLIVQIGGEAQVLEASDHTLQEVARAANVKDSEVILSTDTSQILNGKKVIFDVATQHCYALPTLPSNVYITSVNEGQLTFSPGNITVDLLPLVDSKENIVAVVKDIYSQSTGSVSVGHGSRTVADNLDDIKHSANYPDLQAAIDATNPRDDLLITAGTYPGGYTSGNANLIGVGYGVNFTPGIGKTSLTLSESSRLWQYRHAENFLITGSVDVPQGIGITFGGSPTPNLDGRWNFKHIAFDGLDIGVFKPKGNIGNTYQHCSYLGCNYGHKTESDPNMHVGLIHGGIAILQASILMVFTLTVLLVALLQVVV